jgi:hypothetical protein
MSEGVRLLKNFHRSMKLTLAIGMLVTTSLSAIAEPQVSNKLKDNLLKGYMKSCVLAIQQQLPSTPRSSVLAYCACVGGKTFESISVSQYNYIISSGKLPSELEARRDSWRSQCNSQLDL